MSDKIKLTIFLLNDFKDMSTCLGFFNALMHHYTFRFSLIFLLLLLFFIFVCICFLRSFYIQEYLISYDYLIKLICTQLNDFKYSYLILIIHT